MAIKAKTAAEFKQPSKELIAKTATKTAAEFKKLSTGEMYILEQGFRMGAEFMIDYYKKEQNK